MGRGYRALIAIVKHNTSNCMRKNFNSLILCVAISWYLLVDSRRLGNNTSVTTSQRTLSPGRGQILGIVVVVLFIIILLPQLDSFGDSVHLLRSLDWRRCVLAVALVMLTYFAAAATYFFLAFKRLPYYKTVVAQFAAMFINRLLPSGVGALGVNYAYLRKAQHTPAQAAAIVSVNNLFGLLGHALVFCVTIAFFHANTPTLHLPNIAGVNIWIGLAVGLTIFITVLMLPKLRLKITKALSDVIKQLGQYRQRPLRVVAAFLSSTLLTLCNITSLYICLLAVGGHLSFAAIVVVFTIGIGAGTATPTPGGLGGLEAGMVAGLVAYHVPSATALAAVILYRLISYWLTLVIGAVAFTYCQHRNYFGLT